MAVQYKIPRAAKEPAPLRLKRLDGGLNLKFAESEIGDTQSPYILNCNADDRGAIQKRPGQEKVYTTSLGAGGVHYYGEYRKIDGTTVILEHHGTILYTQSGSAQPVQILTGLADAKGVAFVFNDVWYYINGTNFIQYNGTTAQTVDPYIPTILLSKNPATSVGTDNEELNFISNSWKESFNGDAATTTYTLYYTGLTATLLEISVGGVDLVEGTGFTVNRTNGTVNFAAGTSPHGAPASGDNNVIIQAEKSALNDATEITKCRYATIYGGANDTRILLTGNTDNPSTLYWSGLFLPNYWPVDSFVLVGADSDANTGMIVQYDQCILLKKKSIFRIDYVGSTTFFKTYPLNDRVGCDMPWTIQLVENNVAFCNTYDGPQLLLRTDLRTERNVMPIGGNIIGGPDRDGLLDEDEADLLLATSLDYDGKYHICVGSKVWLWDYKLSPYAGSDDSLKWFYYEGVNANCWYLDGRTVYFGDRDAGLVQKFIENKNDNGAAINAVWRSRRFYFDAPEWLKTVYEVYHRTMATTMTQVTVTFLDEYGETADSYTATSSSFSWFTFAWDTFSWAVTLFPPPVRFKPKLKKIVYFQVQMENNRLNENLSILDLTVYYHLVKRAK